MVEGVAAQAIARYKALMKKPVTMMPARIPVAQIFSIAALALLATAPHAPTHAQSADLVLCDRLAADPADPDKPADAKGVPAIERSDVATAIKFCRVASASSRR